MKHKLSVIFLALGLLIMLAACGNSPSANTTYTGQVISLSLTQLTLRTEQGDVTLSLTDSTIFSMDISMGDPGQIGEPGEGMIPGDGMTPDGGMNPDSGMIDGELDGGLEELPGGGDLPDMDGAMMPGGQGGFAPGGDLSPDAMAGEIDIYSICLGNTLTVVTDEKGNAATVTISREF